MAHILVIEDEQVIRENIIEALELDGYQAQGAYNGERGFSLIQALSPDLVICDIMMPGMDGFTLLEQVRADHRFLSLPFIFLTARADRRSIREGMNLGADDYITKPFDINELLGAVATRLARRDALAKSDKALCQEARDNVTRLVAEEIQRPLDSVNTVLEAIARQLRHLAPLELAELVHTAQYGSQRLQRLVDQIALLARLDTGLLERDAITGSGATVPLREVWMMALDRARCFIDPRPDVDVHLEERAREVAVLCDEYALQHALAEMIANAFEHSPRYGGLTLAQWTTEQYAWFSVTDSGPGMSPSELAMVMGECERTHRGLGLTLARRIAEAHGGGLVIHSNPTTGTAAAIWLPIAWREG